VPFSTSFDKFPEALVPDPEDVEAEGVGVEVICRTYWRYARGPPAACLWRVVPDKMNVGFCWLYG